MKFLTTDKTTHLLVFATTIFGIQVTAYPINSNAQTMEEIKQWEREAWREGNELINRSLEQERQHISGLSCSQLRSEAIDLEKAGDRMAAQGYTSQALGYYNSAERRADAYSRNCR